MTLLQTYTHASVNLFTMSEHEMKVLKLLESAITKKKKKSYYF